MALKYPVSPVKISQGFGANAWDYGSLGQKGHNGIDLAVPSRTPVYASDDGTITFEGWGQNHSWMGAPAGICILQHVGGMYVGYAHLISTVVNKGQLVKKGQLIGYSGATGAATGPHVHWEGLPLEPNFQNGYAGRIDITPYIEGGDVKISEAERFRNPMRVLNSEAKGWNRGEAHSGKLDEQEIKYLAGLDPDPINGFLKYSQQAWDEGAQYRASKDEWLAAFNERPGLLQRITDQQKEIERLKNNQGGIDKETKDNVNWLVKAFKSVFNIK